MREKSENLPLDDQLDEILRIQDVPNTIINPSKDWNINDS